MLSSLLSFDHIGIFFMVAVMQTGGSCTWHGGCGRAAWAGERGGCTVGGRWGPFWRWPTPEHPLPHPADATAWTDSAAPRCPLRSLGTCLETHTHSQQIRQEAGTQLYKVCKMVAGTSDGDKMKIYTPRLGCMKQTRRPKKGRLINSEPCIENISWDTVFTKWTSVSQQSSRADMTSTSEAKWVPAKSFFRVWEEMKVWAAQIRRAQCVLNYCKATITIGGQQEHNHSTCTTHVHFGTGNYNRRTKINAVVWL